MIVGVIAFGTASVAQARCGGGGGAVGAVLGGLLGGVLGAKIDGGRKNTVGTLIGGAIGALAGGALGKALDKCEREQMGKATEASLNSPTSGKGSVQSWTSTSRQGVTGSVAAGTPVTQADGRVCRTLTRVNYIDGQEMQDTPTFCRTPPGASWVPATV